MGSTSATSAQKVTVSLNHWQTLATAIKDEDRLLRNRLSDCPRHLREKRSPGGALTFKETLGHIAFWDSFTVEFFAAKLDAGSFAPSAPVNFEERSREALAEIEGLPFGEVLARYLESTGAILDFLEESWEKLSGRERQDFWVPLKHRRHHRITLFRALDQMDGLTPARSGGSEEMAAGA